MTYPEGDCDAMDAVECLLKEGAEPLPPPDADRRGPLHVAAYRGLCRKEVCLRVSFRGSSPAV